MRLVLTAILSLLAGLATHLLMMVFVLQDLISFEDLLGLGLMTALYSLVIFPLLYLPGLYWLRRRSRGCEPAFYFPLFAALGLAFPIALFVGLMYGFGGVFAAEEAVLLVLQFVVAGAVFGAGFVWHCRRSLRPYRHDPIKAS